MIAHRWQVLLRAMLAGAVAGTVVLGVGGRLVMRLIAILFAPGPAGFSWGGTLEVVGAGALFGTAAALLWPPLAHRLPSPAVGPTLGVATCAGVAVVSATARNAAGGAPLGARLVVIGLFLALCVAYGAAAHALASRWTARP
jgi:hypothetical protein